MKVRIGLALTIGLLASVANMHAALITCSDTTLSALIALGSGTGNGCTVDDKVFNNFSYTPSSGAPSAANVTADLLFDTAALTYGWEFAPVGGGFIGNFSVGFTVTINEALCPAPGGCTISNAESQIFPGTPPAGTQAMSVVDTSNGSPASATISLNNSTLAGTIGEAFFTGATTLTTMATSSGVTASQPLLSYQARVTQTVIPEPATLTLMGASFLSLGLILRRQRRKVN